MELIPMTMAEYQLPTNRRPLQHRRFLCLAHALRLSHKCRFSGFGQVLIAAGDCDLPVIRCLIVGSHRRFASARPDETAEISLWDNLPSCAKVHLHPIRNHIMGPPKNDKTNPIPPGPDLHIRLCGI